MRWKALDDYLAKRGADGNRWLGEQIGCAAASVSRYRARTRRPDDETLLEIQRVSGGTVSATSWIAELLTNERAA